MKDNPTQVAAQEPESVPASSVTALAESYAQMNNEQLAALYDRRETLGSEAGQALDVELSKREAAGEQAEGRAKVVSGVDGWLALLVLSLVFGGPIATLAGFYNMAYFYSSRPSLAQDLVYLLALSVPWFGVYAGVLLWRTRRGAVRVAKAFLLTVAVLSLLLISVVSVAPLPSWLRWYVAECLALGLVVDLIWYGYLSNSKRVAATYPLG